MLAKKRIGMILPHIVTNVDRELIRGAYEVLKNAGYDLVIITGVSNYSERLQHELFVHGRENIFEIIRKGEFAGFLFVASWFIDRKLKDRIYAYLKEKNAPCVVIEEKNPDFPYLFPEQRRMEREITDHLIQVHDCRKLYFISGFKDNYVSQERLAGFQQGLADNGIAFDENCVFYGEFWKEKPYELGRQIACGEIEKPDGIVCASDTMALCLIDGLTAYGMRVPDDVRVVGNDGKAEGFLHTPTLTTIEGRDYTLGQDSAAMLISIIAPDSEQPVYSREKEHIELRGSCGCDGEYLHISHDILNELCRNNIMYDEKYTSMVTDFIENVSNKESLEDLMLQVAAFSFRLSNWRNMAICLCEDWHFNFAEVSDYRRDGFSEKMLAALVKTGRLGDCSMCSYSINTSEMFPEEIVSDEPTVWLLTSLFSKDQIFGYVATSYDHPDGIFLDENFCMWCDTVSRGLKDTQSILYEEYVRHQIRRHSDTDPETGLLSMRGFLTLLDEQCKAEKKYLLQVVHMMGDNDAPLDLNFQSMISVSIKNTVQTGEIAARYGRDTFVLAYPFHSDASEKRMMYRRVDRIENDLLQYESTKLHFDLPLLYTIATVIGTEDDAETIIKQMLSELNASSRNGYKEQLIHIRHQIKKSPEKKWNSTDIADMLHVSQTHLHRLYSDVFGINCREDIIDIRIQKAKRLLKYTDLRIGEIAYQCGYDNESHFMRQFHDKVGVTAATYRKECRRGD